jgi:4-hydroxybenzoate polyprenyltransferase
VTPLPHLPDAEADHWALRLFPAWALPYVELMRLDRPAGWWLLLLPCWWALLLATPGGTRPGFLFMLLFLIGAVVMHGAGSTYDDILDRDLDAKVQRTAGRPIPSGRVSVRQAAFFTAVQALAGFAVLCCFDRFSICLGLASLGLVALYPLTKRLFVAPQLILGLVFSWGGLMGWSVVRHSLQLPALLIYLAAAAWTVGFDTIYALQDIEDDRLAGIRSSARLFGSHVHLCVGGCFALTVIFLAAAAAMTGAGLFAWLGVAALAAHLLWQITKLSPDNPETALKLFRSNRVAGLLLSAGLLLDKLL